MIVYCECCAPGILGTAIKLRKIRTDGIMKKKLYILTFLLISFFIIFTILFLSKNKNILALVETYKICFKYSFINKITSCEEYFASKLNLYHWVDRKDEKSLRDLMGLKKIVISSSKEEKPGTAIKILNFSTKSIKELNINDGVNRPFHFFSETYITPPIYIYEIKDASVFIGNDTRKFLVFKNGFYTLMGRGSNSVRRILEKLLEKEEVFYEKETRNIYSVRDFAQLFEIKNKTIFFHGDWNLYHIIMEAAPGLILRNDSGYKINLSYPSKQNTEILDALGEKEIILTKLFSLEKFDQLILPSPILENNAHFPNIELMNTLIKKLKINFFNKTKIKPLGKKIYVSRSDASRRKVLNESELIKYLKKRGFKIVVPGEYSVADQSRLFEEAEIIIGPHGLGLVNMLFANNLKTVIELFPINWYPNCYLRIAQVKGAKNYYGLFHDPEDLSTSNFNVNIAEIIKILDK